MIGKRYVVKYVKNNNIKMPDINKLNYRQVIKITNKCKRIYAKPNPMYDKEGVH